MSETRKNIRKLPPCHRYDIERIESWLSDMSAEGWELEPEGFNLSFAHFQKNETPRRLEYRLQSVPADEVYPRDSIGDPKMEAVEMSRELGWQYISRYDQFYIYAAPEGVARELNTDTQVQALAMKPFYLYTFYRSLYPFALAIVILNRRLPLLIHQLKQAPLLALLPSEGFGLPFFVIMLCFMVAHIPLPFLHAIKLRKKLRSGIPLDHHADWKTSAKRLRIIRCVILPLAVLFLTHTLVLALGLNKHDIETYDKSVPFVTLQDLSSEPLSYTHPFDNTLSPGFLFQTNSSNYVEKWVSPLASVNYTWVELGYIYEDGETFPTTSGYLHVTYHKAWTAGLARKIAKTYAKYDPHNVFDGNTGPVFSVTVAGTDAAYGYYDIGGDPVVILLKGKTVILARMRKDSEIGSMQEWLDAMAAKLTE